MRESDGLAMSSRNAYRRPASARSPRRSTRVLKDCADEIARGAELAAVLAQGCAAIERAGFVLDYLEARNADSCARSDRRRSAPPPVGRGPARPHATDRHVRCEWLRPSGKSVIFQAQSNKRRFAVVESAGPGARQHATQGHDLLRGHRLADSPGKNPAVSGDAAEIARSSIEAAKAGAPSSNPCARSADHPPQHGRGALSRGGRAHPRQRLRRADQPHDRSGGALRAGRGGSAAARPRHQFQAPEQRVRHVVELRPRSAA